MAKEVLRAYEKRHFIYEGYYNRDVPRVGHWLRYRHWVEAWIEACRQVQRIGRGQK